MSQHPRLVPRPRRGGGGGPRHLRDGGVGGNADGAE